MDLNTLVLNSAGYGAAAGAALPLVASVVLRPHWSPEVKHWIVMALSVVSGLATVAAQGQITSDYSPGAVIAAVAAVYAASQLAYIGLWHRTGLPQRIETATSPTPGPHLLAPPDDGDSFAALLARLDKGDTENTDRSK
ncbi:hypothetical protein [Kitasatospora sp. NPDC088548]|uniref:hypothetical protein n=1 Tax=Kitasatospora sp. NPDC088548 TaxID=3364075 RepID=UPI0038036DB4